MELTLKDLRFLNQNPLFSTFLKLSIRHIIDMTPCEEFKGLYQHYDHIVRNAEICGVIVGIEQNYHGYTYTVDDSTGILDCYYWRKRDYEPPTFTLGQTVQLIGRLNDYRGKRQLTIKQKYLVGPLEEIVHGLEAAKLDEYYRLPYQLFPSSEHSDHQNDEDPFECALLAYWRENLNDIHSFKQACKDTALVELAHRLFSEITAGQVKEKDVIDLFSSTTKALARDGHLALAGPLDYGVFRLMSSQELQKTVLSIVDEIYKLSNHDDGVHKKYIIERFHDFPAYALVPESTITSTINSLLDQGVLYESQYNVYKVVV